MEAEMVSETLGFYPQLRRFYPKKSLYLIQMLMLHNIFFNIGAVSYSGLFNDALY
jgi:mannose/fructose/N-acetylgalactosamine-specific phosphotransferase system component IID